MYYEQNQNNQTMAFIYWSHVIVLSYQSLIGYRLHWTPESRITATN